MTPRRRPVGSPEILATPHGASIAGWEQITLDLSAGAAGLRIAMVVLDETGHAISASDAALYRTEVADRAVIRQESVGGRFERDGTFRGTRWLTVGPEPADDEDPQWDSTRSEPTHDDVERLNVLAAELIRRASRDDATSR